MATIQVIQRGSTGIQNDLAGVLRNWLRITEIPTVTIGDSHPRCRTLDPLIDILLTEDGHDLYDTAFNAVVDTVHTTHASPVTFPDFINSLVQIGLFRQLLESIKKSIVVLVGQRLTVFTNAASIDSSQVRFRVFTDSLFRHRAAFLS